MFHVRDLHGVLPALVTPMTSKGTVDEPAVGRLIDHVLAGGVHGVLPLGSTGESASLDENGRRRMLGATVKAAGGRVPVICGVAQSNLTSAVAEVRAAQELGASAALVAPPYYYPMDQPTVARFYQELAAQVSLPVLVYNIPQYTKVAIAPATMALLAREGAVAGTKDSSRDFEYFEQVCAATADVADFRVFTGSDTMLLASLAMGGAGTICGAGNVAPAWVVSIYDLFKSGDWNAARTEQNRLLELVLSLRAGVFPAAIKAGLSMMGVCEPWTAVPVAPLDDAAMSDLRQRLEAWGLLSRREASNRQD